MMKKFMGNVNVYLMEKSLVLEIGRKLLKILNMVKNKIE